MKEQEVATLLTMIQNYYPSNFYVQDANIMLELWYMDLKNEDSFKVKSNFDIHRKTSNKPPTIADLVKKQKEEQQSTIPSVKDTERYLITLEEQDRYELSEEKKKSIEERFKAIMKDKPKNEWEMI